MAKREVGLDKHTVSHGANHLPGKHRFSVNPFHIHADPTDSVEWENKTDRDVKLFIPNAGEFLKELTGASLPAGKEIFVIPAHKDLELMINPTLSTVPPKRFPYAVYCAEDVGTTSGGTFAEGGSDNEVDVP